MLAMYNPDNKYTNAFDESDTTSFSAGGAGAALNGSYSSHAHGMRQSLQGGGLSESHLWPQDSMMGTAYSQSQYPTQLNSPQMTYMGTNVAAGRAFLQQSQQFHGLAAADLHQTQFLQPQTQQHSFMPMTAFPSTQQQQSSSLLASQSFYQDGMSLLQRSDSASANAVNIAHWNPSMAMPDSNTLLPSFYPMEQDTPQTQQAIALQKAALQRQMQHAYNETQQFEQQLAIRQQMRMQSYAEQQQQHHQQQGTHSRTVGHPIMQQLDEQEAARRATAAPKAPKKRKAKTFPEKFMAALVQSVASDDIVAWLPDGKSFVIVDPDLFVKQVIAPVFKHSKYASFIRKLHRWGFQRLTSGAGTDCFHHPLFQKSRMDLVSKISCSSKNAVNQTLDSDSLDNSSSNHGISSDLLFDMNRPPSLAGVEKFVKIRAPMEITGIAAAAATATYNHLTAIRPYSVNELTSQEVADANAARTADEVVRSSVAFPDNDLSESTQCPGNSGRGSTDPSQTGMLKRTLEHAQSSTDNEF